MQNEWVNIEQMEDIENDWKERDEEHKKMISKHQIFTPVH